jgi:hypothetical protein
MNVAETTLRRICSSNPILDFILISGTLSNVLSINTTIQEQNIRTNFSIKYLILIKRSILKLATMMGDKTHLS